MLGNQAAVIKGAPNPNAAKLFDGVHAEQGRHRHLRRGRVDVQLHEGLQAAGRRPAPYLFDLTKDQAARIEGLDRIGKTAKEVRDAWQAKFQ